MLNPSIYRRPWYLFNRHLESIIPYWRYKIYEVTYERERLELEDGDFIDMDWVRSGFTRLVVLSHAMEGNTRDYFVERAAKYFSSQGYDVLMWNFRGCSREINRLPRFYHPGDTRDLHAVVSHGFGHGRYDGIHLIGYSMGGITTINYLTEPFLHEAIDSAVVFSTPLDLAETSNLLFSGINQIYGRSFLKKWKQRIKRKARQYPDLFDLSYLTSVRSLRDLHTQFTLHLHGFESMDHFYDEFTPLHKLPKVKKPLLIVNAKNDPILGPKSYPTQEWPEVTLDFPPVGGHLGFSYNNSTYSWMEWRASNFLSTPKENYDLTRVESD